MAEEITITLSKTVKIGDIEYTELKLREPTAGELEDAWSANPVAMVVATIAKVAGIPLRAARLLSQTDYMAAAEFLTVFSQGGRADIPR